MNVLIKSFLVIAGCTSAFLAVFTNHIPASIVSAGAFIAYAIMEPGGYIKKNKEEYNR
jgi:hypothetical protein